MKSLTKHQIFRLTDGKKHWSERKQHLIKLAKNFGIIINNDEELKHLIEVHCVNELRRLNNEFMRKSKEGILVNNYTLTDVKNNFLPVTEPIIGKKYHISWAYSGAVFVLKNIKNDICYLDNPKHKRKTLLTCKLSELRELRNKHMHL